jgi:DNA-binding NarL/FixJ family response regulator
VVVVPDTSALETDAFSDDLRRTWARLGPYIIAVPDAARRIRSAGYRGRMETVQSDTLTTAMVPAIRRGQRRAALLPTLLDAAMTHLAVCHGLSARETDVMIDVLAGLTAKETGRRLDISHRTVDIHRAQMMKKVGVRSAGELGQKLSIAAIDLALATARPKPRPSDETSDQAQPARMPYRPAG